MIEQEYLWWQKEILYQIYPRSFKDSNDDGIGDLPGILQKLDYLQELGIKGVWISPFYPSPMADFGYDVSDYIGVHPMFGTIEDFDNLLKEIHNRDMKLILDFVPNHTSNEHPWFQESIKSRDDPKREWYIWKDPGPDGGPPNNWGAAFGGSGWEYDDSTGQYYYHAFLKEQPDLNWRNPEVQEAMFNAMRFWLDKGVDGFRVDVMWHMIKDDQFRDNPINPDYTEDKSPYDKYIQAYNTDQPEVHEIVKKMRNVMDEYDERVMIGEIYLPIDKLVTYYGEDNEGTHLPFNFLLVVLPWDARKIEAAVNEYEGSLPPDGWPNWVLGNHDNSRMATRVGKEQARIAAMLLLTLRGTPTMYYGDEIGMEDVEISADEVMDPQEKNIPGKGLGRDPERTPMQWDDSPNAGFSSAKPWLPIMENYQKINVANELENDNSTLNFYKKLIKLRNNEPALQVGNFIPVPSEENIFSFIREYAGKKFLIALNFGSSEEKCEPGLKDWKGKVKLATHPQKQGEEIKNLVYLGPHQGVILEIIDNQ